MHYYVGRQFGNCAEKVEGSCAEGGEDLLFEGLLQILLPVSLDRSFLRRPIDKPEKPMVQSGQIRKEVTRW